MSTIPMDSSAGRAKFNTTADTPAGQVEMAASLDLLLTQAALGSFWRFFPGRSSLRFARALASRPGLVTARTKALAGELARVAAGSSATAPSPKDRRFTDPAWTSNPLLRRVVQAYLATGRSLVGLVDDASLDWRDAERMRFVVANLVDALAPSNNALLSPLAWNAAIDSRGGSILAGTRNLVRDFASSPRVPSMVPQDAFEVGKDLALTPGAVVLRTPMFELIQYESPTATVREVPLLIVPPTINKYYILDLAPGRSLIEYLVSQGQRVFVLSWRNPDARHAEWGLDQYVRAIMEAVDATASISGANAAHLLAACAGGALATLAAAVTSATGAPNRVASLSLLVTMLDQSRSDSFGALVDDATANAAIAASSRTGYLDGDKLAEVFAWLRPGDLIWNYWVNNYLQGREPAKFDILFWNSDTTRMTAALHRDFVHLALDNPLPRPGGITVLDTEVNLAKLDIDSYVVAGVNDHICAWKSCYRSSQLLGGKSRFVLSSSGHIAALVNPADNKKSRYQVSDDNSLDPDAWQQTVAPAQGSWWPDYAAWLGARSGDAVPAPASLGSESFRVLEPAPGSYVRAA